MQIKAGNTGNISGGIWIAMKNKSAKTPYSLNQTMQMYANYL